MDEKMGYVVESESVIGCRIVMMPYSRSWIFALTSSLSISNFRILVRRIADL